MQLRKLLPLDLYCLGSSYVQFNLSFMVKRSFKSFEAEFNYISFTAVIAIRVSEQLHFLGERATTMFVFDEY